MSLSALTCSKMPSASPVAPMECTPGYRFPFTPFPFGWYRAAMSREVARGEIKRLKLCGRELIVFRGEDGHASVLSAYCPHLGADLSKGGKVIGNTVACPFHDWRFASNGDCVEIPYCAKIPPKAKLDAYPTREQDGLIFFWFHPRGVAPTYALPKALYEDESAWHKPLEFQWTIRMHIQEVAENAVDVTHFPAVHKYATVPSIEDLRYEGPSFTVALKGRRHGGQFVGPSDMWIQYTGLGVVQSRVTSALLGRLPVEVGVVLTTTPIDDQHVDLRIVARHRKTRALPLDYMLRPFMRHEIRADFQNDIPIWESKIYQPRPTLCRDDGPIGSIRKWARQFYLNELTVVPS